MLAVTSSDVAVSITSFLFAGLIYLAVRLARLSERVARIEGRLNGKHDPNP